MKEVTVSRGRTAAIGVLSEGVRQTEVRNWVKHLVLPTMADRR